MKKIVSLILAFAFVFSFASCKSEENYAEKIYNSRVSSVENIEKVEELFVNMDFYILTAYCNVNVYTEDGNIISLKFLESLPADSGFKDNLKTYTALLFSLVKKLDTVQWEYIDSGETVRDSINSSEAEEMLGTPPDKIYGNYDKLLSTLVYLKITDKEGNLIDNNSTYTFTSSKEAK